MRLRDFPSIVAYLSDREIDELEAAIDARRKARTRGPRDNGAPAPHTEPRTSELGYSPNLLEG